MKDKKLSYSTIHIRLTAVTHFYIINRVNINRKYLANFKPIHRKVRDNDKAYNHVQIQKMFDSIKDYRDRVMVLLMASSGIRIGALPFLTIGNLTKVQVKGYSTHIYKITVYQSEPEQYYTFTTFELATAIDNYLDYRQRSGEILKPKAPLLREHFNPNIRENVENPEFISHRSFHNTVDRTLQRTGLKVVRPSAKKELNDIPASHGFRKFTITQMKKAHVDFNDREFLVGHKHTMGLDSHYDRTSEEDRLQEYLKAMDLLTINDENRLRRKVQEQDNTIQVRMAEKDQEIKGLRKQIDIIRKDQEQVRTLLQSNTFKKALLKKG
ncbi:MAG: hypothetical protein ACRELV_14645 [Longimicrobiales bacterium]